MTPRPVEAVDEGTSLLTGATTGDRDDVGPGRTYRASSSSSSSSSSSTPIAIRDDDERGIRDDDRRIALHLFLEARTPHGLLYEKFIIFLILLSVITFVLSSVYVSEYNVDSDLPSRCDAVCDALWFGNNNDNALSFLNIGSTSLVEIIVVFIFTIDYVLRMYVADMEDPKYAGINGRLLHYVPSFYSIVDLSSILPFYVDSFVLTKSDISSSNYLRMFRLLRMMKVEGRYDMAMTMIDDALYGQRGILGTALFVGVTVWGVVSSSLVRVFTLFYPSVWGPKGETIGPLGGLVLRGRRYSVFVRFSPLSSGEEGGTSNCVYGDVSFGHDSQYAPPPPHTHTQNNSSRLFSTSSRGRIRT